MFDVVRRMVERKDEPGVFEVFDGSGAHLGVMDFTLSGDLTATAESPWGTITLKTTDEMTGEVSANLRGTLLARLGYNSLETRMTLRMASGQEIVFKVGVFSGAFNHRSDLGEIEYRPKQGASEREQAQCSVMIKGSYGVKAEDVALALLSFYGYRRVAVLAFRQQFLPKFMKKQGRG